MKKGQAGVVRLPVHRVHPPNPRQEAQLMRPLRVPPDQTNRRLAAADPPGLIARQLLGDRVIRRFEV